MDREDWMDKVDLMVQEGRGEAVGWSLWQLEIFVNGSEQV